jgi:hypothetical protein
VARSSLRLVSSALLAHLAHSSSRAPERIATLLRLSAPDFWRKKLLDAAIKCVCPAASVAAGKAQGLAA